MVHHGKLSGWLVTLLICCCLVLPAAAANAASVWTDQPDYPPGSTVTIQGSGWQPGETVNVLLHEDPTLNADILLTPTADGSGNFATPYVIEATDLGVKYTVTATGAQSNLTATTSFTDAPGPGTAPVNPPIGGFGIDGNVQANAPTVGIGDWVPGPAGGGGNVLTASGVPIVPGTTFHGIDLYNSGSDNNFAGGNKFDGNPNSEWTWVSNPVNDKEDLNNGLIHFSTDGSGHTWVMVAADRLSNNGDAYIDFEFLQNTLSTTGGPTGGGFTSAGPNGGRTAGDFVLTLELTRGGGTANFFVNRWEAVPVSSQAPAGYDYVDRTSLTPLGSVFAAVNATSVPVSYGAFGSTTYDVNTFAEGGIDLTALLGAIDNCTSLGIKTILIKTKESQSPTATIVDFIAPIQLQKQIGLADAGPDQHLCSNSFTVTGTATPAPGDVVSSTLWEVVGGSANIASPNNATTAVTVTGSPATLRFTVNTSQGCTKFDEVVLTVDPVPTCLISGPDGPLCPSTADQTYSGPAGMATYAWSISGNGTINGSTTGQTVSVTAGSGCNSSFVLTLVVTNEGGCTNTCTKSVEVKDTTAPVIAGVGADHTIQCDQALDFSSPTASDNCGTPTLVPADVSTPGSCAQNHDVTRTWTATDACNNSVTASQTIHVVDTTAPTLVGVPVDASYQCASEVPQPPTVTATDNCDPNPGVVFAEGLVILDGPNTTNSVAGQACSYHFTRTWTATDHCNNSVSATQTINVHDTTNPVITGVGADHTIQCDQALDFSSPTASDNCGTPTLVPADVSTPGSCLQNHDVTRTWTATDECGNSVTASQTIHVVDTTAPTLVGVPVDASYQCASEVPQPPTVTATDSCDPNPGVVFAEGLVILDGPNTTNSVATVQSCSYHFTRTWTATDHCNNSVSATQTINVHDTTNPVITGVGADHTIQCDQALDFSSPTASDNCGTPTLVPADVSTPGSCLQNHDVTRTWTATDECGNSVTASQTIHVVDTTAPTLVGVPVDANYQCASEVPQPPTVTATDNCDPNPGVVFAEGLVILDGPNTTNSVATVQSCSYHFTRTWTATDHCNNSVSATQTINVHDTTNPVITGVGADHTIQCDQALDFSSPTASDNCGTPTLVPADVSTPGSCLQNHDVTRTWTATDECGNSVTASQTIHVVDTTAPTLVGVPVDANYQCASEVPQPPTVTATDNCDPNPGVVFAEGLVILDGPNTTNSVATVQSCSYHFTRTWTATDHCNNSVSATQTINVHDTTNPVITGVGADHTIQCDQALDFSSPTASDNCGTPTLVPADVSTPGSCLQNHDVTRTWTATDECGNSVTASQTIHVVDTTAPTLVGVPVDANYQCASEVPQPPTVTATDNCDPNPGVVFAEGLVILDGPNTTNSVATVQSCSYHFTRTWTATDHCNNSVSATQTINVHDTTAPTITCPDNITVGACQPVNFAATGSDNCGGLVTFTYNPEPGTTFALGTTTVHVTGSDFCGNTASCDFTVTVTPSPTVTVTGVDQICQGGSTEFCGPDGNYDYAWTGPGGFVATTKCTGQVSAQGQYTLVITDKSNTCTGTGNATLTVNPLPACSITGKTETCANVAVDLCGPDGNYGYVWSGPGGFSATDKCISVSAAGDYSLTTTDLGTKCSNTCSAHLTVNQCVTNCPRTPGFWAAQCDQSPTGKTKFDTSQMNQITSCVDDKASIFNWPSGSDFSYFCSTVSTGGSMDQRRQAKRQFASFLANICTGELGLIANNGDIIKLDLSTPVSCPALTSTTLGGLITEVDDLLLSLEVQSLSDPVVKAKYSQIISCLDAINNAEGVGTVCSTAQQQNALYADYASPAALSALPGDLVELYRPSPNPFASSTRIAYVVNGKSQQVEVGIFDIAGRRVRQLANGFQAPGRYELNWDGRSDAGEHVVNGVYFIRSIVAGHVKSMQVVLLK